MGEEGSASALNLPAEKLRLKRMARRERRALISASESECRFVPQLAGGPRR